MVEKPLQRLKRVLLPHQNKRAVQEELEQVFEEARQLRSSQRWVHSTRAMMLQLPVSNCGKRSGRGNKVDQVLLKQFALRELLRNTPTIDAEATAELLPAASAGRAWELVAIAYADSLSKYNGSLILLNLLKTTRTLLLLKLKPIRALHDRLAPAVTCLCNKLSRAKRADHHCSKCEQRWLYGASYFGVDGPVHVSRRGREKVVPDGTPTTPELHEIITAQREHLESKLQRCQRMLDDIAERLLLRGDCVSVVQQWWALIRCKHGYDRAAVAIRKSLAVQRWKGLRALKADIDQYFKEGKQPAHLQQLRVKHSKYATELQEYLDKRTQLIRDHVQLAKDMLRMKMRAWQAAKQETNRLAMMSARQARTQRMKTARSRASSLATPVMTARSAFSASDGDGDETSTLGSRSRLPSINQGWSSRPTSPFLLTPGCEVWQTNEEWERDSNWTERLEQQVEAELPPLYFCARRNCKRTFNCLARYQVHVQLHIDEAKRRAQRKQQWDAVVSKRLAEEQAFLDKLREARMVKLQDQAIAAVEDTSIDKGQQQHQATAAAAAHEDGAAFLTHCQYYLQLVSAHEVECPAKIVLFRRVTKLGSGAAPSTHACLTAQDGTVEPCHCLIEVREGDADDGDDSESCSVHIINFARGDRTSIVGAEGLVTFQNKARRRQPLRVGELLILGRAPQHDTTTHAHTHAVYKLCEIT